MPSLYIITGSNGAGKSTTGVSYLPQHLTQFFDGDKLYMQHRSLLWRQGHRVDKEIRQLASDYVDALFEKLVSDAIESRSDFVYEGHFSQLSSWNVPKRFKEAGYTIYLIFMGLSNPELSAERVLLRAKEGGHFVDLITLRENFYGNMEKLQVHISLPDLIEVIDCSYPAHKVLAIIKNGSISEAVPYSQLPDWLLAYLPSIAQLVKDHQAH